MTISVENRARAAFGLLLILGAAAGILWYSLAASRYRTLEIRTRDSVSGLTTEAPVEFHGVEVGSVTHIRLVDAHSVSILLSVKRDTPVSAATVATITSRGLAARGFAGYVYVALEDAGDDSRPLMTEPGSSYPTIRTVASKSESLDTTASDVRRDVQMLTGLLQSVLDRQNVTSLDRTLENLQTITQILAANKSRLQTIISNADRASAHAERASATAERASRQLEPVLESSREAMGAMQTQVLPEAYATLVKLHRLSESLQELTTEIEHNPSILVRGKRHSPPGPGEKR